MLPRVFVSRPRLLEKLARAMQCKLTVVCADAGYGKTTLVAEFASQAGVRTEWYSFTTGDRDIARLVEGLEACLRRLASRPDPGGSEQPRARQVGEPSVAVFSEMLLRQAAGIGPEKVLLVLDDYQNVDQDNDVNLLIGSLIANSPSCLRFAVLSRSSPRFPLAEIRARQEYSTLGEDELAFTVEETTRFLCEVSGLGLDEEALAQVQDRTEGWAAAIAMVAQSLRYDRRDKVMAILADPVASAWLVYDYLAEAVFDRQEADIQDFLLKTSVLSRMTAGACDHLLRQASSQRTLLALEERGMFITSVDPARQHFRYHQLFREFLRQRLYQRETRDAVRDLNLTAAQYYEQVAAWDECVRHYLKAQEPLKAAEVVEAVGDRYIFSGFYQTIEYWLRMLPEDLTSTRPWLLVLAARVSHMAARHEESLRLLERALRIFQIDGDQEGQAWTIGEMGFVSCRAGLLQQSIRYFASALPMAGDGSILKSQLLVMRAQPFREVGMLEAASDSCLASLAELVAADRDPRRARGQSRAARNLAITQMEAGDLEAARRTLEEALSTCVAQQIGEYEETWVRLHLGAVLWACGDLEEASRLLNQALSMSGRYIRHQRHTIALWLGNSYRDSGYYDRAEKAYAFGDWRAEPERVFLDVLAHRSQLSRAEANDMYMRYKRSESLVARSMAEAVFSAVLRECQELEKARAHVNEAVAILSAHGYNHRLASALLHQARLEYELLRLPQARETLDRAMQIASASGYYHFFWWDPEMIAFLCCRALADGICPDYAVELAIRRLDGSSAVILAPLLQSGQAEVRRRALTVLSLLPRRETGRLRDEILSDCGNQGIRSSLLQAIGDHLVSPQGIQTLRTRFGASWREVEIFTEYYLRPAFGSIVLSAQLRRECASRLNISENTVRCHVNNLRRKLGLPRVISGKRVLDWAEQEGLLPGSDR